MHKPNVQVHAYTLAIGILSILEQKKRRKKNIGEKNAFYLFIMWYKNIMPKNWQTIKKRYKYLKKTEEKIGLLMYRVDLVKRIEHKSFFSSTHPSLFFRKKKFKIKVKCDCVYIDNL